MSPPSPLDGARVLLVEDNFLVAASLQASLERLGCVVVGPVTTAEEGLRAAADETLHAAILDINIIGGTSVAIAETLRARRCPVIFVTGYTRPTMLPESMLDVPALRKPVDDASMRRALLAATAAPSVTDP